MGAVKTKRMPRAVREQQMLDAAVRTFGNRGYMAASMDEIAELAGVSKPLVYLYLNSKEDLFTACIRREARALTEAVRAGGPAGLPADRQLWAGLTAVFTHTARPPDARGRAACGSRDRTPRPHETHRAVHREHDERRLRGPVAEADVQRGAPGQRHLVDVRG